MGFDWKLEVSIELVFFFTFSGKDGKELTHGVRIWEPSLTAIDFVQKTFFIREGGY
jgi:hypothetical protein